VPVRRYVWLKDDPVGMEHADLSIGESGLTARSVAIGSSPVPYRLDLDLTVDQGWVSRQLGLAAVGDGWARWLVLDRDVDGSWHGTSTESGALPPAVEEAKPLHAVDPRDIPRTVLDVDVQWSPLTNLMPIRRLGLTSAGVEGRFTMAWVSVPALTVTLDEQRYTLLGVDEGDVCARFDSGDGLFAAVLRCDSDGVVLDYPGVARRLR
jgi:uncharacterized protein